MSDPKSTNFGVSVLTIYTVHSTMRTTFYISSEQILVVHNQRIRHLPAKSDRTLSKIWTHFCPHRDRTLCRAARRIVNGVRPYDDGQDTVTGSP